MHNPNKLPTDKIRCEVVDGNGKMIFAYRSTNPNYDVGIEDIGDRRWHVIRFPVDEGEAAMTDAEIITQLRSVSIVLAAAAKRLEGWTPDEMMPDEDQYVLAQVKGSGRVGVALVTEHGFEFECSMVPVSDIIRWWKMPKPEK